MLYCVGSLFVLFILLRYGFAWILLRLFWVFVGFMVCGGSLIDWDVIISVLWVLMHVVCLPISCDFAALVGLFGGGFVCLFVCWCVGLRSVVGL